MSIYDLLLLQVIAHLLADFTFQSEDLVQKKNKNGFKTKDLYVHAGIYFLCSFILSNQLTFIFASSILAIFHLIIDGFKEKLKKYVWGKQTFFFDQAWHIVILIGVVILHHKFFGINQIIEIYTSTNSLLFITAFLFCTKPCNILIKEIFTLFNLKIANLGDQNNSKDDKKELLNAGKLIGISERLIILTLLIYRQFEAVGFLIAAKSILRYEGKASSSKSEYVLIGTLLSFGFAIAIYVLLDNLIIT